MAEQNRTKVIILTGSYRINTERSGQAWHIALFNQHTKPDPAYLFAGYAIMIVPTRAARSRPSASAPN